MCVDRMLEPQSDIGLLPLIVDVQGQILEKKVRIPGMGWPIDRERK